MNSDENSLNWFEIPTIDIDRARKFYETTFAIEMTVLPIPNLKMVVFPSMNGSGKANGALVEHEMYAPSDKAGVLIYLNANPEIQRVIDRIEPAGGKMILGKTQISPEIGYMCLFLDSEGNRLALHAQN